MALICFNEVCDQHLVPYVKVKYKLEEGELVARCQTCRGIMCDDGKSNIVPGVPRINKFDSMSDDQKKAMLIKRSTEDFKKNGERYDDFRRIEERCAKSERS